MLDGLSPYAACKDSALPWIGRIPSHWDEKRAKYVFREVDERSKRGTEELLSVSHITGVTPRSQKNVTMFMAESTIGHKICRPGDLVVNTMWAWMGALGISRFTGLVSPAYGVYRPVARAALSPGFAGLLLRLPQYVSEYIRRSTGIQSSRLRLYPEQLLQIPLACPHVEEQALIERFVANADRCIRRYIRVKTRLIALLNEQKRAIVVDALTRGLTPGVARRPSGVEFLGDVPADWRVGLLGRCLQRIEQGWSPVAAEGEALEDQWAVLTLSSVRGGMFNAEAIKPIPLDKDIPEDLVVSDGDLLLTRSNTRERVGDACIVRAPRPRTILSDLIYRLKVDAALLDSRFLMYELLSAFGRAQIERAARGSSETMPKIAQRRVGDEMSLLRAYWSRLVADVVTGKLDVREAAAHLPEEPDDAEPVDVEDALADDADAGDEPDPDAPTEALDA